MGISLRHSLLILLALLAGPQSFAQDDDPNNNPPPVQFPAPRAVPNAVQRYEIDAKRTGVSLNSDDALPRSREFLRIDSTYYVGWLYEGGYKSEHAADYAGYRNAAAPLERALRLIIRDYKPELRAKTANIMAYITAYKYQIDFTQTAYLLLLCYYNTEDVNAAWQLLQTVKAYRLPRDYYMDVYNQMAWTVHRNRFYTSSKYPFLKNSIDANEALANTFLDSGLARIRKNAIANASIFPAGYEQDELLSVYHYKCVLYSYQIKIDSAEYYFNKMRKTSYFPHNNYANFLGLQARFKEAEEEYEIARNQELSSGDKRLQEWVYYTSIIDIYKHKPKKAEALLSGFIKANGSTPGFGWYQIARARALYYDGQMEMDKQPENRAIGKAAEFKEVHIGTTLGENQYRFAIELNKYLHKEAEWEMQKFQNANWWYNPAVLGKMARIAAEQYLQQFLIIGQFSQNPERNQVIYKVFSSESVVSWDEVWYLIRDFSTRFFTEKYTRLMQDSKRPEVTKYYRYFVARLHLKAGKNTEARQLLLQVMNDKTVDPEYDALLLARCAQAMAESYADDGDDANRNKYLYTAFQIYPQLLPYAGLQMNMNLHVSGTEDKVAVEALKACNINWTGPQATSPQAFIEFGKEGNVHTVSYYVVDNQGNFVVPRQKTSYRDSEGFGRYVLPYALFGVGGKNMDAEEGQDEVL